MISKNILTFTAVGLILGACSQKPNDIAEKGTAMPPPAMGAQPKGLNLTSPTIPDVGNNAPNPAPAVEETSIKMVKAEMVAISDEQPNMVIAGATLPSQMAKPTLNADLPSNQTPDMDERLANLEAAVALLRADYDTIAPTFKTLSVNSDRLSALLSRMEGKAIGVTDTPSAMNSGNKPSSELAASAVGGDATASVNDLRIGNQPDKTRIVFDMDGAGEYLFDLDNAQKAFIVSMPTAMWNMAKTSDTVNSQFIEGWSVQSADQSGGVTVVFQLKKEAIITGREELAPADGMGPRIYFDIGASNV